MALMNHTTVVPVEKTLAEISGALVQGGARSVTAEYLDGRPSGLTFAMASQGRTEAYRVPVNVDAVQRTLIRQWELGRVDRRFTSREQAERVAWRILRDWIRSQLAVIDTGLVTLDQVLLPYMEAAPGRTVYDVYLDQRIALPSPRGPGTERSGVEDRETRVANSKMSR